MPPEIAERAAMQQLKAGCAAAVVLTVVVVGGLYYQAHSGVSSAKKNLSAAQAEQAATQAEINSPALTQVAETYAQVAAAKIEVTEALGGEIRWSRKLDDLSLSIPSGVWLTGMTIATGPSTSGALTANGIDTITFTGMAMNRNQVATWLESLVTEKGYADPYLSSSQEVAIGSKVLISFTSTVTVTDDALSGRYLTNSGS